MYWRTSLTFWCRQPRRNASSTWLCLKLCKKPQCRTWKMKVIWDKFWQMNPPMLLFVDRPSRPSVYLEHCTAARVGPSSAVGRSAVHVDRSSATAHASSAESLESRTIWLIHVVRGLPAGRFQPWCGVSPDLVFTASFRVCTCSVAHQFAHLPTIQKEMESGSTAVILGIHYVTI